MSVLARFFGAVPKKERGGIRLEEGEPWRVGPTKDVERFIRALPLLVPEDSVAYFEGTGESHVAEYLRSVSILQQSTVAIGTIWPRPDRYHVPLTVHTMEALAAFLDEKPAGYFCAHCHVYRNGRILLQWHNAFTNDPIYVSGTIPGETVASFAQALGSSYGSGWLANPPLQPTSGERPTG
jgi:hypothetical protein